MGRLEKMKRLIIEQANKRILNEEELDYSLSYDIKSFDCGNNVRSGHVDVDGDTIVIRYCEGNEEDLEYLKKKGRKLYYSTHLSNPLLYPLFDSDDDSDDDGIPNRLDLDDDNDGYIDDIE